MSWVLLLEDDNLQVKIISDVLKHHGLDLKATSSKDEALAIALENPDLIISDICLLKLTYKDRLKDIDGIIFSQSIKTNPATSHIPLIIRSSMPLLDLGLTLHQTKADEFISKSTGIEELVKLVQRFVK